MSKHATDRDWEQFAKEAPYWAVLTEEKFKAPDANAIADFFQGGDHFIGWAFQQIQQHFDANFAPRSALDFGCGVGRLLLPLAQRCERAVGVDVSTTMLETARQHAKEMNISNVECIVGDDTLSGVKGSFDFVNTYIVLQHIPVDRGTQLFARLVDLIAPGGFGCLHVTYGLQGRNPADQTWFHALRNSMKNAYRAIRRFVTHRGKMQMNHYDMNAILYVLQNAGVSNFHAVMSNHGGPLGTILIFKKPLTK
jgi:SAM-dependent methyltransferase